MSRSMLPLYYRWNYNVLFYIYFVKERLIILFSILNNPHTMYYFSQTEPIRFFDASAILSTVLYTSYTHRILPKYIISATRTMKTHDTFWFVAQTDTMLQDLKHIFSVLLKIT